MKKERGGFARFGEEKPGREILLTFSLRREILFQLFSFPLSPGSIRCQHPYAIFWGLLRTDPSPSVPSLSAIGNPKKLGLGKRSIVEPDLGMCSIRSFRKGDQASIVRHANDRDVWINLRDRFPQLEKIEEVSDMFSRQALIRWRDCLSSAGVVPTSEPWPRISQGSGLFDGLAAEIELAGVLTDSD